MSQEFTVLFMSHDSQRGHFWKQDLCATKTATDLLGQLASAGVVQVTLPCTHLFKHKRLLVPHRVNSVGCGGPLGAIFLLGVPRQPNQLHLDAGFHIFVR